MEANDNLILASAEPRLKLPAGTRAALKRCRATKPISLFSYRPGIRCYLECRDGSSSLILATNSAAILVCHTRPKFLAFGTFLSLSKVTSPLTRGFVVVLPAAGAAQRNIRPCGGRPRRTWPTVSKWIGLPWPCWVPAWISRRRRSNGFSLKTAVEPAAP